jgi:magnesium chelatase subunit H
MVVHPERARMLAARVAKLVALRRKARAERRVGLVIFNFPPNAGNTGTAAYLSVFRSILATLRAMKAQGYTVDLPADEDALRARILHGNAERFGALANVGARMSVDDHIRRQPHLAEIEKQWGPAPGRHQTDGSTIHILGECFGNVFIGVQPGFGYEGDPMRLLFEHGFAPTHAFCAFYRWLREDFQADAVLHFGTHGALEFMPGKQAGMSAACWPDRLIGDLPNFYLYASNNPSEGMLAKRRANATLISYLTPPVAHAGLYRGLLDLKGSLDRWRALEPESGEALAMLPILQAQAAAVELAPAEPAWENGSGLHALSAALLELEYTLIPHGLHALGELPSEASAPNCWTPRRSPIPPSAPASTRFWRRSTRSPPSSTRWMAASSVPSPAATSCAPRKCCRRAETSMVSTPSASPAPSPARTAPPRPSACWPATAQPCPRRSLWSSGAPTT